MGKIEQEFFSTIFNNIYKGAKMKYYVWFIIVLCTFSIFSILFSTPGINGSTAGCEGGNCHSFNDNIVSAVALTDLQVEVTVSGVSAGENVAGELVDQAGIVVVTENGTKDNPFVLQALSAGTYTVNAGYKKPTREWDSVSVSIGVTGLSTPESNIVPDKIALLGNHPNPFNQETIISFSLPSQQAVTLSVFDMNGKLVRHLNDRPYAAGINRVRWDGRDDAGNVVASGVYIVQMKSEGMQFSHRILLSK